MNTNLQRMEPHGITSLLVNARLHDAKNFTNESKVIQHVNFKSERLCGW